MRNKTKGKKQKQKQKQKQNTLDPRSPHRSPEIASLGTAAEHDVRSSPPTRSVPRLHQIRSLGRPRPIAPGAAARAGSEEDDLPPPPPPAAARRRRQKMSNRPTRPAPRQPRGQRRGRASAKSGGTSPKIPAGPEGPQQHTGSRRALCLSPPLSRRAGCRRRRPVSRAPAPRCRTVAAMDMKASLGRALEGPRPWSFALGRAHARDRAGTTRAHAGASALSPSRPGAGPRTRARMGFRSGAACEREQGGRRARARVACAACTSLPPRESGGGGGGTGRRRTELPRSRGPLLGRGETCGLLGTQRRLAHPGRGGAGCVGGLPRQRQQLLWGGGGGGEVGPRPARAAACAIGRGRLLG